MQKAVSCEKRSETKARARKKSEDHLAKGLFMISKQTAFRCPEELLQRAKKRAEQQGRTLSNYIKNLIREDLEKKSVK
jgi:predicted HicB family RNase H-like nuclease